ncbi:GIY-YIG nuclease family protein [Bradyrhizobium sp. 190]|uniref:GIY-YIG nuclease family protein n=1 Tax=Bradyrhizobium sp. 190 TaxID=2782658 RepID=UPI001FFA6767|nr:GIY-YIG nuclease family protein [Bradyrhizobium sp. 190]
MWYVYIIRSISFPDQEYIGATADLKRRLPEHNAGKSAHTAKFKPWELIWYCAFPDKYKALAFEKYLKSHSGRAFAKKRLRPALLPQHRIQPVAQRDDLVLHRHQFADRAG